MVGLVKEGLRGGEREYESTITEQAPREAIIRPEGPAAGSGSRGDEVQTLRIANGGDILHWIRRYILFHASGIRGMGAEECGLLVHLATVGACAATQNQALNALVFLYRSAARAVGDLGEWIARGKCGGCRCADTGGSNAVLGAVPAGISSGSPALRTGCG